MGGWRWELEVGGLEVGSRRLEVGSWKLEVGSLEVGGGKLEVGGWRVRGWALVLRYF